MKQNSQLGREGQEKKDHRYRPHALIEARHPQVQQRLPQRHPQGRQGPYQRLRLNDDFFQEDGVDQNVSEMTPIKKNDKRASCCKRYKGIDSGGEFLLFSIGIKGNEIFLHNQNVDFPYWSMVFIAMWLGPSKGRRERRYEENDKTSSGCPNNNTDKRGEDGKRPFAIRRALYQTTSYELFRK